MNMSGPSRFRRLKNIHVRRLPAGHFLRQSETTSASSTCHPGEIGDDDIDDVVASSKDTCIELGFDVSDEDVQATRESFAQLFASDECWDALCGEESDPSVLFFKILFNEAAACANVQMNLPECVMETVSEDDIASLPRRPNAETLDLIRTGVRSSLPSRLACGPPSTPRMHRTHP
mmetsp:Transcript_13610/g.31018  ORF Transcript_13610/g.31018 Transcript_13610/m.31018 type:complete len:176 (+) Transcript_13610:183-710(+)